MNFKFFIVGHAHTSKFIVSNVLDFSGKYEFPEK